MGKYVVPVLDDDAAGDKEWVLRHRWYPRESDGELVSDDAVPGKTSELRYAVMSVEEDVRVERINKDGFDYRRDNLRVV